MDVVKLLRRDDPRGSCPSCPIPSVPAYPEGRLQHRSFWGPWESRHQMQAPFCLGRARGSFPAASFPLVLPSCVGIVTLELGHCCVCRRPEGLSGPPRLAPLQDGCEDWTSVWFSVFPPSPGTRAWSVSLHGATARGLLFVCAVTEVTWLSLVSYSTLLALFFFF